MYGLGIIGFYKVLSGSIRVALRMLFYRLFLVALPRALASKANSFAYGFVADVVWSLRLYKYAHIHDKNNR